MMKVIAEVSTQIVPTTIEETGLMPNVVFAYRTEDARQEQSWQSGKVWDYAREKINQSYHRNANYRQETL